MRKILLIAALVIVLIGAVGLGIVTLGVVMLRGGGNAGSSPPPPAELPLEITIDVPERIKDRPPIEGNEN